jgi:hypothetical protein
LERCENSLNIGSLQHFQSSKFPLPLRPAFRGCCHRHRHSPPARGCSHRHSPPVRGWHLLHRHRHRHCGYRHRYPKRTCPLRITVTVSTMTMTLRMMMTSMKNGERQTKFKRWRRYWFFGRFLRRKESWKGYAVRWSACSTPVSGTVPSGTSCTSRALLPVGTPLHPFPLRSKFPVYFSVRGKYVRIHVTRSPVHMYMYTYLFSCSYLFP